jgi:RecA/RadA recombinase
MQESCTPSVATYPNSTHDDHTIPRPLWRDPHALKGAWGSPVLVGRTEVLARQETTVLSGLTPGRRVAVSISGPRGSGTSTVAAHLVGTDQARLTRPEPKGTPLLLRADVSACRTPLALVTALFRDIDPAFIGRGASTEFLTLLLLRRIRTVARPTIIWLDQIRPSGLDVSRVLRPLAHPEQLLPEGPAGLPAMLLVASGAADVLPDDPEVVHTELRPLPARDLCKAIMTRANLAFNAPPSLEAVEAIASLSISRGWGLSMVGELLAEAGRRAEARGGRWLEVEDVALPASLPRAGRDASSFEAVLLEVLRAATGVTTVGKLKRALDARCQEAGLRQPTQARLWRHLVGLERKGLVRREVRVGGAGGSRTEVALRDEEDPAQ